jgi:hypothetical protein
MTGSDLDRVVSMIQRGSSSSQTMRVTSVWKHASR